MEGDPHGALLHVAARRLIGIILLTFPLAVVVDFPSG